MSDSAYSSSKAKATEPNGSGGRCVDAARQDAATATALVEHLGGCHCGAVRFSVLAPANIVAIDCNCSICRKKQNYHFIVPKERFRLLSGQEALTTYTFNSHQAKHTFCKVCGVQSFYTPRSNPDGYGVMPHCLDEGTVRMVMVEKFDGIHWEQSMLQAPDIRARSKL